MRTTAPTVIPAITTTIDAIIIIIIIIISLAPGRAAPTSSLRRYHQR